jgi:hypothetical protein
MSALWSLVQQLKARKVRLTALEIFIEIYSKYAIFKSLSFYLVTDFKICYFCIPTELEILKSQWLSCSEEMF